jgi:homoserine dehydrogenase
MNKKIKIGLFGFGCVGQGLYRVLSQAQHIQAEIVKIGVKDLSKPRTLPAHLFTGNAAEILDDPSVDVVVELISDAEAAYDIVTTSLKRGKHVVTANKKMVAAHLPELVALQEEYGASLLYEASSCGSIPIIRTLEEYYDNELLHEVKGIFNGSSNFILSKIFNENLSYATALKQAQGLGFAEADPTLDIGGYDSRSKLAIIAAHAFGIFVHPEEIFCYGIDNLKQQDIDFAKENNFKIRLVARAQKRAAGSINLSVIPQFVKSTDKFYSVENEYNAVLVEAAFSDQQAFIGKGAGGNPTGSAVLSDISALTYDYRYEYKKKSKAAGLSYSTDQLLEVYIRTNSALPELGLVPGWESSHFNGGSYIKGKILLSRLLNIKQALQQAGAFVATFSEAEAINAESKTADTKTVVII